MKLSEEQAKQGPEIEKQNQDLVREALRVFKDHRKQMTKSHHELEAMRQRINERIRRGASQTDSYPLS